MSGGCDPGQHDWQPAGRLTEERVSCSPCSTWDDHIWEDVILIAHCQCGAVKYTTIGFQNRRRRGDDFRRRDGLEPLGVPLRRSGRSRPKVRIVRASR